VLFYQADEQQESLVADCFCALQSKKSLTVDLRVNIIDQLCSDLCQPIVVIWRRMFTVPNIIITE
jgi:hypothetical protein